VRAVEHWTAPSAKLVTGQEWRAAATSMIDISDSLASEAGHIAQASGVRLVLDELALHDAHPRLFRASQQLGFDALQLALYGGEDYALLATGLARKRPVGAKVIGVVERGRGAWLSGDGHRVRLKSGFDHLRV
jgi:thiamine-monophosphate kinase